MALNPKLVAQRLKRARETLCLEIDLVCEVTGITQTRLKQIESAQSIPTGDEVLILANFYRFDFRIFLYDDLPDPFEPTDILYRQHGNVFKKEDRQAIQEFLYLCEIESSLEKELNITKKQFQFTPNDNDNFFKRHGEQAAQKLRDFLGYKKNEVPRDIFSDFRKIGFHVFRRKLINSNISGLYIDHPFAGHCLLVNYDEDIYRQRFSVSHEAAHAIFDSSESVVVTFYPGKSAYKENDLKEIRANRFASCFLLPPDQLPRITKWNTEEAIKWSQAFRVSSTALAIALKEANLVDIKTLNLISGARVFNNEKIDPEAPKSLTKKQRDCRLTLLEKGLSDYYVGLCFEAYHHGIISIGRLSETLLATHSESLDISILFGRSIKYGD